MRAEVAVMDVGGTHATAGVVDLRARALADGPVYREPLDGDGSAEDILSALVRCAAQVPVAPGSHWAVAVPGPFDYEEGTALYSGVGKFDALYGVDVRAALLSRLPGADSVSFHNDAHAFLAGEWWAGAAAGHERAVGITLGTGVGSAFLRDGRIVSSGPGLPPEGRVDLLTYAGLPLEETVSRRAIRRAYSVAAGGDAGPDVRQIAEMARAGDPIAGAVFRHAFYALGAVLGPCLDAFGATVLVVGGSISASWDQISGPLAEGLAEAQTKELIEPGRCQVERAHHPAEAPLLGAAHLASQRTPAA